MSDITMPVYSVSRHRMGIDGSGVTTLVASYGCPLSCKYCINPEAWDEKTIPKCKKMNPKQLFDIVKVDHLYFLATGGGVTFGGGESLLHAEFLKEFRAVCGEEWNLTAETSLNVSKEALETAIHAVNDFIVDIKDMNPDIYKSYTGRENEIVKDNLQRLAAVVDQNHIKIRVPAIPEYNTKEDIERSVKALKEMGFVHIEVFPYVVRDKKKEI